MRIFTLYMPVGCAAALMAGTLPIDGPAYRALTPGWEKPFYAACNENKAICRKLEIEDSGRGFGVAKVLVVTTAPGKAEAGVQLLESLISADLRPGISVYSQKGK